MSTQMSPPIHRSSLYLHGNHSLEKMIGAIDISEMTTLDLNPYPNPDSLSPKSPQGPKYFVQSPPSSDDSSDKSLQSTTPGSSPSGSPWYSSSSGSRFSNRSWKLNWKRWPAIEEEEKEYHKEEEEEEKEKEEDDIDKWPVGRRQCLLGLMGFVCLFTVFCLIIGGLSTPYRPRVTMKSLTVNNFYFGEGSDFAGVPSNYLTVNCSVEMTIYNPATFFGLHVSFTPADLSYYGFTIASGQLKKYYQPRKSQHIVSVNLEGKRVALYGAGPSLTVSDSSGGVPVRLEFGIRSRGNVVGMLVRTKHRMRISCSLIIDSSNTEAIKFKENPCTND